MNGTPFARGGIIPSGEPGSDLVLAVLKPGEHLMSPERFREWAASGLSLEDWMRQNRLGPYKEADDGDES